MRAFANVRLEDAEVGAHRVLLDAGMTAPIRVETVDLGEGKLKRFPFIKLSEWVQHLLDTDRLSRQMVGVPTIAKMKPVLKEFWTRFRGVNPTHGIFALESEGALSLDTCIPFYSHTDEGRSYKHLPLWILSSHGAIGRGTRSYLASGKHKAPLRRNPMGLNFLGKTWSTNFIFASVLQTVTAECPEAIPELVEQYAADVRMLLYTGIFSRDGQTHVTFAHIGTKGDLPALVRLGSLKRSFYNVPRGPSSKKACQGICHLCLAGREGQDALPFEDVGPGAGWVATIAQSIPWNNTPAILAGLPLSAEDQIKFFNTDLWHNAHLGVVKHFTASAYVAIVESDLGSLPAGSVETKFRWISNIYKAYFRSMRVTPLVSEINRDTLNFPASTASPIGKWSKGSASTEMMMFLDYFCRNYIDGKTADPILVAIDSWLLQFARFGCSLHGHIEIQNYVLYLVDSKPVFFLALAFLRLVQPEL